MDALVIKQGNVTLASMKAVLEQSNALTILSDGSWLLQRNIIISKGATLMIDGKEFPRLLLKIDHDGFIRVKALGGRLTIEEACISSWEQAKQDVDRN